MNKPLQTKKVLALIVLIVLTLHIGLALAALIFSNTNQGKSLLRGYQRYFLSGPYFTDETVRSSYHLYVEYKIGGHWEPAKDYAQEDFLAYCNAPWRYHKLHLRRYPLYLARQLARMQSRIHDGRSSPTLIELTKFSEQQWIGRQVDSVSFTYCSRTFNIESSAYSVDTIYHLRCTAK